MNDQAHARGAAEDGVGVVSSLAGVLAFLAFLLFAVQLLVHLYATSLVSAAAFDAARVASGAAGAAHPAQAREHGLRLLGRFAANVTAFDVDVGETSVAVRVTADSPALLPRAFGRLMAAESIDRQVHLRLERPLCAGC